MNRAKMSDMPDTQIFGVGYLTLTNLSADSVNPTKSPNVMPA